MAFVWAYPVEYAPTFPEQQERLGKGAMGGERKTSQGAVSTATEGEAGLGKCGIGDFSGAEVPGGLVTE